MNSWGLFAWLFTAVEPPLVGAVQSIIAALSGYVAPILKWFIVAYVAGRMIVMAYSPAAEPLMGFLKILFKCAIAYWIVASAATYNQYLGTLLLTTLPTEISHVISGANGSPIVNGQAFDDIWNKAWSAGLAVYRDIPWTIKGIGLQFAIVIYWLVALLSIAIGFLVYLCALVILALLIAVGILFAAMFPFTATRGYFDRWIAACLSMVLLQIFVVTLLSLLVQAVNTLMAQISNGGGNGFSNANEIDQLQMLLGAGLLFFVSGIIAKQLPAVAVAVAGGVCADVSAFGATVYGAAGTVGSAAARGTGAATTAAASGTRSFLRPAGQSLSGDP